MKSKIFYKCTTWISVELTEEEKEQLLQKLEISKYGSYPQDKVLNVIFETVSNPYFENECEYEEILSIEDNDYQPTIIVDDKNGKEIWNNLSGDIISE